MNIKDIDINKLDDYINIAQQRIEERVLVHGDCLEFAEYSIP